MTTTATAEPGNRVDAGDRTHRRAGLPVRLCAAIALASVGAHAWMGWEHRAMPWESLPMLLMAAACLPCAVAVWRRGHDGAVQLLFVMALAMVAVHAALLLAPGALAGHHHGAVAPVGVPMNHSDSHPQAMLGIVALELAVAMLAAWAMRRGRACAAK